MEVIFDCFFEETFAKLERSGLKARKKRKDVIDHLNAIISGCCKGKLFRLFWRLEFLYFRAVSYLP